MIKWFKKLQYIVANFNKIETAMRCAVANSNFAKVTALNAEKVIRDRTTIGIDVSPIGKDPHVIMIMGRYKNRDFVQCYSLRETDIRDLIERIKEQQRYGTVRRIDAPPSLKAIMEHDPSF